MTTTLNKETVFELLQVQIVQNLMEVVQFIFVEITTN